MPIFDSLHPSAKADGNEIQIKNSAGKKLIPKLHSRQAKKKSWSF